MTFFDDPNREAVGLAPIWGDAEAPPEGDTFDPGAHTVAEVEAYLDEHPDERDAVLAAERAGKNRASLREDDEDE